MKKFKNVKLSLASQSKGFGRQDAMKERIKTLEYFISSKIKTINGLIFRNEGRGLIGILLKYIRGVRPRASKSVVKQVAGFVFFISRMAKHSGLKGVVIYLKASQVLLQQCVGGFRVIDLSELKVRPARNRAGVPLIIPAGVRVLISRDRDIPTIKLWMTLLGLYRVLEFRGKLSLSTITDRGPNINHFLPEWEEFLSNHFKPRLEAKYGKIAKIGNLSLFPILKSGPTTDYGIGVTNSSGVSLAAAARIFLRYPQMLSAYRLLADQMGFPAIFYRMRLVALSLVKKLDMDIYEILVNKRWVEDPVRSSQFKPYISKYQPGHDKFLGKLGFKIEPAGKIRVFAMVDAWTQWLLAPLHKWIFSILERILEDGTFNQLQPMLKLQRKFADNPKRRTFASIDLSAATDRLPISLQASVLRVLLKDIVPDSTMFAKAWADLLVDRHYKISISGKLSQEAIIPRNLGSSVKYSVGQPMGALSSWAMLALTHHAIVQYAYFKAYKQTEKWFENYGVLGDDLALADGRVIAEYRRFLSFVGVKAGLAKSIISKSKFVIEFAKKFFVDSVQANMLPIKECIATSISTSLVLEFTRKYDLTLNQILAFLGFGYKARMKSVANSFFSLSMRMRVLLVWLSHPSSPIGKSTYYEWLFQKSWRELHEHNPRYMVWLVDQARGLVDKKVDLMLKLFEKYQDSINNMDKTFDKEYPINIISAAMSKSGELRSHTVRVPWKVVLDPDLTSKEEGDFWDASFDELTSDDLVSRIEKFDRTKLGIDFDEIFIPAFGKLQEMYDNANGPLQDQLEALLTFYFEPDLISSRIPESFWAESRESLRPFRDFLQIYRIWQDLTKPLWADFYKRADFELLNYEWPDSELSLLEHCTKYKMKSYSSHIERMFQPAPGDLEGLTTMSFIKKVFSDWVKPMYNYTMVALFLLVELGIFTIMIYILCIVSEPKPIEVPTSPVMENREPTIESNFGLYVMGISVFILMCTFGLSYYYTGSWESAIIPGYSLDIVSPTEFVTDMIRGHSLGVQGPMTLDEYNIVQTMLESQALLDNLAISPIGDLWITPWD